MIVRLVAQSDRARLVRIRAEWGLARAVNRNIEAIANGHRSRVTAYDRIAAVDDRTWEDLHLDDVFAAIDRTDSTLGQHALYHRLRAAPTPLHVDAFEALVTRFSTDTQGRERAQLALARLKDPPGYDLWWLARPDTVEMRPWFVAFPILAAATLTGLALSPLWLGWVPVVGAVLVINVFVRKSTDGRIGAMATAFRQLAPLIAAAQSIGDFSGDDVASIVGPLRTETSAFARLKTISRWVSGDPFMLPVDVSPLAMFAAELTNAVYEYFNLLFLLDANGVYFGARELRSRGPALLRVIAAMGEIDAAISVASLRAGTPGWTRPRFLPPGSPAVFTDLRHPLVDAAVPNSIELGPPYGVLITGSNMSGKTTFLRTLGVTTVLAQTINTCLAAEYAAPVLQLRSCIGRRDDLLQGKSYYLVEVEAVLSMVRASQSPAPHLFLFDELFRGTNAVERIAAAEAVLTELTATPRHLVVTATHDVELVDLLRDRFVAYHLSDRLGPEGLVFEYRLAPGPATTRNAIALLDLCGAPDGLVARAMRRAAVLDRERSRSG